MRNAAPELVLHLAAQPLVRRSYRDPIESYQSNVMGTVHVLEAARHSGVKGAVCITTDKVYYNREWAYGYRETDRLGGSDPYSASKAAAEIVIDSYRSSMTSWQQGMLIAAARGGNIIGGGDWAEDRLIPDFARAARNGTPIILRNPAATRPWQHVLALIHGYMMLLARMADGDAETSSAWNLGPAANATLTVGEVVARLRSGWEDLTVVVQPTHLHETTALALDSTKAQRQLGWKPGWSTEEGIDRTAEWYAAYTPGAGASTDITRRQIEDYRASLTS
jgi:CDP-glucose 4,6-dehydratase